MQNSWCLECLDDLRTFVNFQWYHRYESEGVLFYGYLYKKIFRGDLKLNGQKDKNNIVEETSGNISIILHQFSY